MWFHGWSDLVRVLLVGSAAYFCLIALLRISGKRTLAKLNAFDLVVTVALGSTLATILLSADVSWVEGMFALALLAGLQFVVALITSRLPGGRAVLTARPTLLLDDGRLLHDVLVQQRVSPAEVRQAIRAAGVGDLSLVGAVVLETDGSMSVIRTEQLGERTALRDIANGDRVGRGNGPPNDGP